MANQTQPFFKSIFWMYFGLAIATVFFWSPIFYSPPEKGLQSNFQKEYQFCKDYLGSFQSGDKNKVVSLTDEGLIAGLIKVFPGWMDGFKKSGEIRAMYLIEVTEDKNSNHIGLKYYIDYKNTSGLMDMVIVPIGGSYKVVGIHPNPLALSYENN